MVNPVPGELAGIGFTACAGAIAALWRRANVLQDRQTQRDDANLARVIEIVERVTHALEDNTDAIRESSRAV